MKENISLIDTLQIAERLDQLEIATWSLKSDPRATVHIGPMAQDFMRVFGVGGDDKGIGTGDGIGVALAGAQAAYRIATDQRLQINSLRDDNQRLAQDNRTLRARLDRLEQKIEAIAARCP